MELKLILPVPTSLNKLYINQSVYNPKTKQYVPTGKRILSPEGKKVKSKLQAEARIQLEKQKSNWDFELTKDKFVIQDVTIHFARRGSDGDNIFKLLNDSLKTIVYHDDDKVYSRVKKIVYNPKNPHIIVEFSFSPQVGIFDSQDQAKVFEARCEFGEENGCSRYRNGRCSILQDVLNGTIREEVDMSTYSCNSFKAKK